MDKKWTKTIVRETLPEDYAFNLSDFALFLSVMKNKAAYEYTLSIILDEPALFLEEVKVEQVVLNKSGKRAIRLDAWARDAQNGRSIRKCRMTQRRMIYVKDPDFTRDCWIPLC